MNNFLVYEKRKSAVIRKMSDILQFFSYTNVRYLSSDAHAHYFQYESIDEDGTIEVWDLQVEIEGNHEINHKPVSVEDWYYVGETFQELMECYEDSFVIAI
ncbi:hypothetical protein ACWE42_11290 [Sutcliffiella cohnii]